MKRYRSIGIQLSHLGHLNWPVPTSILDFTAGCKHRIFFTLEFQWTLMKLETSVPVGAGKVNDLCCSCVRKKLLYIQNSHWLSLHQNE